MPRGISYDEWLGWSSKSQGLALQWMRRESTRCSNCKTRPEEWAENQHAYVVEDRRCMGCEIIEQAAEQVPPEAKGMHLVLVPNDKSV